MVDWCVHICSHDWGWLVDGKCDTRKKWHTYGSVMGYTMSHMRFLLDGPWCSRSNMFQRNGSSKTLCRIFFSSFHEQQLRPSAGRGLSAFLGTCFLLFLSSKTIQDVFPHYILYNYIYIYIYTYIYVYLHFYTWIYLLHHTIFVCDFSSEFHFLGHFFLGSRHLGAHAFAEPEPAVMKGWASWTTRRADVLGCEYTTRTPGWIITTSQWCDQLCIGSWC